MLSGCCMVNLKKLSLSMNYGEKSMAVLLLCLLKSSPFLQDLAIKLNTGMDQKPSECLRNRLETVMLNLNCKFQRRLIGLPIFLLGSAERMRKLTIRCSPAAVTRGDLSFQGFCGELLLLPRASPTADVEIIQTCQ